MFRGVTPDHFVCWRAPFPTSIVSPPFAVATAAITRTTVAQVTDWDEVYKYVKKTGEFDLLQKRMSDVAYRERLDAGKPVPGTEPFIVVNLSLTKSSKE